MKRKQAPFYLLSLMFCFFLLVTCKTAQASKNITPEKIESVHNSNTVRSTSSKKRITDQKEFLDLTFAGDIMAHTVNFSMNSYDRIYDDVRTLLISDDLTFGNFEAPINDNLAMSTYPLFNTHSSYLSAAIAGGFDVFSLANNHANDQGSEGIQGTLIASDTATGKGVYFSGLRHKNTDTMEPVIIHKHGWTLLFLAVTEVLNSDDTPDGLVYYVAPNEKAREIFLADLERMRREHFCDAFVLSLHSNEPEYVHTASDSKKQWFIRLANAGVDIVWAHHPHVMQEWKTDVVSDPVHGGNRSVLLMYSMGNFISGQRFEPDMKNPDAAREYTGDAVLLRVRLSRQSGNSGTEGYSAERIEVRPFAITNWNDPRGGIVVRRFTEDFVKSLPSAWKDYYLTRYSLLHECLPLLPATPGTGILGE